MFAALRNITILICTALIVLTLIAGMVFKQSFIETIVTQSTEAKAEVVVNTYIRTIWNKYYPVVNYLSKKPVNEWGAFSQFSSMQKESEQVLNIPGSVKTVVYNKDLTPIYDSANASVIFPKSTFLGSSVTSDTLEDARRAALAGQETSVVILKATTRGPSDEDTKSILSVFTPIKVNSPNKDTDKIAMDTIGVLELNFDTTAVVNNLEVLQFTVIFTIIIGFASFTIIILLVSRRAEVVVEKQQEASMEMAAAKAAAEGESRSKSQFLANVSHELRTPLNAIIGFSEIIDSESMGPIGNEQYKEFIKDIHTSGVHLLSLINDILDFSKAEENKLQVDFEQVDLTKLLKICTRMVLPRAEEAKVNFIDDVPQEHFVLVADPKRLKQVILNLFSNAVKFTPENGSVSVKVWRDHDSNSILIEIRDTGVGMAAQDLARALAPFGQVDNKLSRRYEGTGLGLPLTKKLVELMRGKFDVKSEIGLGTTITISFPLPTDSIEADEGIPNAGSQTEANESTNITAGNNTSPQESNADFNTNEQPQHSQHQDPNFPPMDNDLESAQKDDEKEKSLSNDIISQIKEQNAPKSIQDVVDDSSVEQMQHNPEAQQTTQDEQATTHVEQQSHTEQPISLEPHVEPKAELENETPQPQIQPDANAQENTDSPHESDFSKPDTSGLSLVEKDDDSSSNEEKK